MIRAHWSVLIARSAEEVFDFVADLDNESLWNPDAANTVRTSPGAVSLGAVWEQDFPRAGHVVSVIDGYERPSLLSFATTSDRADARVVFRFAPAGDGATEVECDVEIAGKGWFRLREPFVRSRARRRMEEHRGPGLKAALESR